MADFKLAICASYARSTCQHHIFTMTLITFTKWTAMPAVQWGTQNEIRLMQIERALLPRLIEGYCDMVEADVARGYEAHLVTFMFDSIGGSERRVKAIMKAEVEKAQRQIETRVMRHPKSTMNQAWPLYWIAVPDRPVPKHERKSLREVTVNDGWHVHAIVLIPPFSRLKRPFDVMINEHWPFLTADRSFRLHARAIDVTVDKATRYVLKAITRHTVSYDDLLVLKNER